MVDYTQEPGKKCEKKEYKDSMTLISVITPFYSGQEFIKQTANSVLNQTFPYFEWIIVDDGSSFENKKQLLSEIEKMDSRIKVYYKKNEGLALTRDYGAKKASETSKYLFFLDDDDLIEKTYLETAYYCMETYKDASWCYADSINFGCKQLEWKKHYNPKEMLDNNLLVATALIRKEDYEFVNGYELKEKNVNEDWNFWLKLIASKKYPIHMSYDAFWYRIKNNGELARATKNHKKNMEIINKTKNTISYLKPAIEFPRSITNWKNINDNQVIVPEYKKNHKKNILMIIPWMVMGGADQFNLDLLRLIDKDKFNFTILTTQPTEMVWRQKFEKYTDSIFELSTFLDQKYWPAFIEYIIKSRNVDLIFISNSTTGYEIAPYIKAKFPTIPIMDYIHMEEWYNRDGGYSRDSAAFHEIIDKTLFCNKNSERIMHDYFKVDSKILNTVYIGVDEKKYNPKLFDKNELLKKYNIPPNKTIINFVARIDYQKRPMLLIEIIKKYIQINKNVYFIVAGDGPLLNICKKQAKKHKLNSYINFLGKIDNPAEIYAISDLSLNCSIKEGVALTSYESLSMNVPVISSNVGGQSELINEDVGITIPCLQKETEVFDFNYSTEEIDSYVKAINFIINNLSKYKKNCRKRIVDKFTLDKMAINMTNEIESTIINPNKYNIERGKKLYDNINIIKEYINQYFLANNNDYYYLCSNYYKEIYKTNNMTQNVNNTITISKKRKIYNKIMRISEKMHIYNETLIIINFIFGIYYSIKQFLLTIFNFVYKLLTLEIKRTCNIVIKLIKG
jgi:glycosyltransferase involved in cell wall biosynthesis